MGEVFRAERSDGAFDRQVAIKVMRSTGVDPDLHPALPNRTPDPGLAPPSRTSSRCSMAAPTPEGPRVSGDGAGERHRDHASLP